MTIAPPPTQPASLLDLDLDLDALRGAYLRDGYVIIDDLFTADLPRLRQLSEAAIQLTRTEQWPRVRRVGKQFPPYDTDLAPDYWGVQHLMHPDLPQHDAFRAFYAQRSFLAIAAALMSTDEDHLQMELFNLLIEPRKYAFALSWHRDDVRPDVGPEEEQTRLDTPAYGVQFNAALYDDDCLFIVPGTHTRLRTDAEIKANRAQPPSPTESDPAAAGDSEGVDGSWQVDPPTTLRVALKAGQTAFYSQRLLHRASYLPSKRRATLHGCYGMVLGANSDATAGATAHSALTPTAGERARMILQHGVDWMKQPEFGADLAKIDNGQRLQAMWRLLIREYAGANQAELGYSLDG